MASLITQLLAPNSPPDPFEQCSPEVNLWKSVLQESILDLLKVTRPELRITKERVYSARGAREWFLRPIPKGYSLIDPPPGSFRWICLVCNLCPETILEFFREDLKKVFPNIKKL